MLGYASFSRQKKKKNKNKTKQKETEKEMLASVNFDFLVSVPALRGKFFAVILGSK